MVRGSGIGRGKGGFTASAGGAHGVGDGFGLADGGKGGDPGGGDPGGGGPPWSGDDPPPGIDPALITRADRGGLDLELRRRFQSGKNDCCTPNMARNIPSSVVTPPALGARQWESATIVEELWMGINTNDEGWRSVKVDRPTMFWSLSVTSGPFLYFPHHKPVNEAQAIRSAPPGLMYMPFPGIWWVKYSPESQVGGILQLNARVLRIDVSDPMMLSFFLSLTGGASAIEDTLDAGGNPGDVIIPVLPATIAIVGPRRERWSVNMQNVGANPIRATYGDNAPTANRGFLIAPGQFFPPMGPDTVSRKSFQAGGVGGTSLVFGHFNMQ